MNVGGEELPNGSASNVIQIDQFDKQLNKQRINFTKLLFKIHLDKIRVNAGTIGLRKSTYKSKYILFKMNFGRVTIDLAR